MSGLWRRLARVPIGVKLLPPTATHLLLTVGLYGAMDLQDLAKRFDTARDDQQAVVVQAVAHPTDNTTLAVGRLLAHPTPHA